jgi:hypothetical protein
MNKMDVNPQYLIRPITQRVLDFTIIFSCTTVNNVFASLSYLISAVLCFE